MKKAGCKINGQNVRMDRQFVMEMVEKAPSTFDITPRNVNRKITVGGPYILFGNVSSPPAYWDLEISKKIPGTRAMFANFCKLSQYFNCIHFLGGYPVEPVDLHPSTRHLDAVFDKLILSDKVAHAYSLGKERVEDVESVLSVVEEVKVKVLKIDRQGRIDLSIKALLGVMTCILFLRAVSTIFFEIPSD